MKGSLERLLEQVFDYAGLFPPARLDMEAAVAEYLRHRSGAESQIMDRFVCSSTQLESLGRELAKHPAGQPIPVAVVGLNDGSLDDALVHDAEKMTQFLDKSGSLADIEAYEVRLPDLAELPAYLQKLQSFNQVEVYGEVPWGPDVLDALSLLAERDWLGAKARTGGLQVDAYPMSMDLAGFIRECVQLELPFKLTAGLHHPFRSHREEVATKMHGFLNVLVAATLALAQDLATSEISAILDSESVDDFRFTDTEVAFRDYAANLEQIDEARDLFIGIGSCSVEEPISDLRAHQL